jgi:hypothetical protein
VSPAKRAGAVSSKSFTRTICDAVSKGRDRLPTVRAQSKIDAV